MSGWSPAGVVLPAVLADRLGIEGLVEQTVDLGDWAGAANPGRRAMPLVSAMALGADCIDDCEVLRSSQTRVVLGHTVAALSTLGTFFRHCVVRGWPAPVRVRISSSWTWTASLARSWL